MNTKIDDQIESATNGPKEWHKTLKFKLLAFK